MEHGSDTGTRLILLKSYLFKSGAKESVVEEAARGRLSTWRDHVTVAAGAKSRPCVADRGCIAKSQTLQELHAD